MRRVCLGSVDPLGPPEAQGRLETQETLGLLDLPEAPGRLETQEALGPLVSLGSQALLERRAPQVIQDQLASLAYKPPHRS